MVPHKNPEEKKQYRHRYYEAHRGKAAEQAKEYYDTNSDGIKTRIRKRKFPHKRAYTEGGGEWKCFKCGKTWDDGVQLDIHHKDMNNTNNEFGNLVCLCKECHDSLHLAFNKITIPDLIRRGIVSWEGEVRV